MIKNKLLQFLLFAVIFLIVWNIGDYFYSEFITRSGFHYAAKRNLIYPASLALGSWLCFYRPWTRK